MQNLVFKGAELLDNFLALGLFFGVAGLRYGAVNVVDGAGLRGFPVLGASFDPAYHDRGLTYQYDRPAIAHRVVSERLGVAGNGLGYDAGSVQLETKAGARAS